MDVELDDLCKEISNLYERLRNTRRKNCDVKMIQTDTQQKKFNYMPAWNKIHSLKGHRSKIIDLRWTFESKYITSTDSNSLIVIWRSTTGLIYNVIRTDSNQIVVATTTDDASVVFAGGTAAKFLIYTCNHRPESDGYSNYVEETSHELAGSVTDISYFNLSDEIAVSDDIMGVGIYKIDPFIQTGVCKSSSSLVRTFKILKNQNVLCGCSDGVCRLYDYRVAKDNLVGSFMSHSSEVTCLDLSPNEISFISGSDDRFVNMYDFRVNFPINQFPVNRTEKASIIRNLNESRKQPQKVDENIYEVTDCCYTPSGRMFMSSLRKGSILTWDIFNNSTPVLSVNFFNTIIKMKMSGQGERLAVATWNAENSIDIYEPIEERSSAEKLHN